MVDWTTSEYTKGAGLTVADHAFLLRIKGKKSIAGKLNEIIAFYKKVNKIN